MLYTEPFFATGNGFLTRTADEMAGFRGAEGQAARGQPRHHLRTWATANAEKYGFEVQRYDTFPDACRR